MQTLMLVTTYLLLVASLVAGSAPLEEDSEKLSPWGKRWSTGKIGFHQESVNRGLLKYGHLIVPNFNQNETCAEPPRVFVPLCGKTVDMAFLAQHASVAHVVGCEGIVKAIEEFASEHPNFRIQQSANSGSFEAFRGSKISIFKGDFFALDKEVTDGGFQAIWDRASFVAIQPSLRDDYVNVLGRLIQPGGTILLSTLERREGTAEGKAAGPPFSVPESEVRRFYEGKDWVESVTLLEEHDVFANSTPENIERFRNDGVTAFYELLFEIRAK